MQSTGTPQQPSATRPRGPATAKLTLTAVSIALVFIVTYATANYTIPATKGYFDFGDVMIFIVALTFGPVTGGLAGGIGSAASDAFSTGSGVYAPFTLVIKGLEGLAAGYLAFRGSRWKLGISWSVASAIMVGGYFIAETLAIVGYPASVVDVFVNIPQVIVGGIIGIPISQYLRRVLPPNTIYSRRSTPGSSPKA